MSVSILFLLSLIFFFFSPILGILLFFISVVSLIVKVATTSVKGGYKLVTVGKCPYCRTNIRRDACVCPNCHRDIVPEKRYKPKKTNIEIMEEEQLKVLKNGQYQDRHSHNQQNPNLGCINININTGNDTSESSKIDISTDINQPINNSHDEATDNNFFDLDYEYIQEEVVQTEITLEDIEDILVSQEEIDIRYKNMIPKISLFKKINYFFLKKEKVIAKLLDVYKVEEPKNKIANS